MRSSTGGVRVLNVIAQLHASLQTKNWGREFVIQGVKKKTEQI
jgi:hypothetical protein